MIILQLQRSPVADQKTTVQARVPPERKLFMGAVALMAFLVAVASMFDSSEGSYFQIDATTVALLGVASIAAMLFVYPNIAELTLSSGQVSIKLDKVDQKVDDVSSSVAELTSTIAEARDVLKQFDASLTRLQKLSALMNAQNQELGQLVNNATLLGVATSGIENQRGAVPRVQETGPPALKRPVVVEDDPEKGRWGGLSERDGWIISARFGEEAALGYVPIVLKVASTIPEQQLSGRVTFYLHPTFGQNRVLTVFAEHGFASVEIRAWGGFTVGAWLHDSRTELELDLAELPYAPTTIQEN